jgi:hypothetical protein
MEASGSVRRRYAIQRYSLKDLVRIYNTTYYSMRKKLSEIRKEIGQQKGYFYEAEQVEAIFKLIRLPSDIEIIK